MKPVLIAGGGIGGLAAALGLAQKGHASVVLEQAPQIGEIGAGIQIGPNAFHAYVYHPDGAQRLVRNAVLHAKTPEDHYRSLEWLYGGTGLASTA